MEKPSKGPVLPVLGCLGHQDNLGKLGPNMAQILQIMIREKSNLKSSAHHFRLNDALLKCKSHLKVQSCLFQGIWGHQDNLGELGPSPQISQNFKFSQFEHLRPKICFLYWGQLLILVNRFRRYCKITTSKPILNTHKLEILYPLFEIS